MKNLILVLFVVAWGVRANADTPPDTCIGVIQNSAESLHKYGSKTETMQEIDNFCRDSENYSSSKLTASLKAEYQFVTGSIAGEADYSKENINNARSEYCSASDSSSAKQHAFSELIRTINIRAYDSYNQCIQMSKKGLTVAISSSLPTSIIFEVHYSSDQQDAPAAEMKYELNAASSSATCVWSANATATHPSKVSMASDTTNTIKCTRPYTESSPKATEEASITLVRTNSSSASETFTFNWLAVDQNNISISSIKKDIHDNHLAITKLQSRHYVRLKSGNNGGVDCNTYCSNAYAGWTGTCMGTTEGKSCSFKNAQPVTCLCLTQ